jgi:hypothetical protein
MRPDQNNSARASQPVLMGLFPAIFRGKQWLSSAFPSGFRPATRVFGGKVSEDDVLALGCASQTIGSGY